MANFDLAYNITKQSEGGYTIDTNGYEVYRGINRYYNPSWSGWPIIDKLKQSNKLYKGALFAELDILAANYVKQKYWNVILADQINNQAFANLLFDSYYQQGTSAIKHLQQLLNVKADGVLGPKTLFALNEALKINAKHLYNDYLNKRISYLQTLVPAVIPANMWIGIKNRLEKYKNVVIDNPATAATFFFSFLAITVLLIKYGNKKKI